MIYYNRIHCDSSRNIVVIIEDNGVVAYAYLVEKTKIVSDVWLYNSGKTPLEIDFSNREFMPFQNPIAYTENRKRVLDSKILDEVQVFWEIDKSEKVVELHFHNGLRVKLESGTYPGWSNKKEWAIG
jgi:hypothetical protein